MRRALRLGVYGRTMSGVVIALAYAFVACRAPRDVAQVSPATPRSSASKPAPSPSASGTPAIRASTNAPSSTWSAAEKQPTTPAELQVFTGHWKVTGTALKLRAYRDGDVTLKLEVEEDTASYRAGELRFELDMALNGKGFSVYDHGRPDPGDKVYGAGGLANCGHVMTENGLYEGLEAKVVDPDTLRVQRLVWVATFETAADGSIVRCVNAHPDDETWDELKRAD